MDRLDRMEKIRDRGEEAEAAFPFLARSTAAAVVEVNILDALTMPEVLA